MDVEGSGQDLPNPAPDPAPDPVPDPVPDPAPAGAPTGGDRLDGDAEAMEDPVHAGDARHQREQHELAARERGEHGSASG